MRFPLKENLHEQKEPAFHSLRCAVIFFMERESEQSALFIVLSLVKMYATCESAADPLPAAFCGWLLAASAGRMGCVCVCARDYASSWRALDDILRLWQRKHAGQQLSICDADDIEKLKSVDLDGERASFFTFLFADALEQHNLNNQPTTLHRYWSMLSEQTSSWKLRHVCTIMLIQFATSRLKHNSTPAFYWTKNNIRFIEIASAPQLS